MVLHSYYLPRPVAIVPMVSIISPQALEFHGKSWKHADSICLVESFLQHSNAEEKIDFGDLLDKVGEKHHIVNTSINFCFKLTKS